MTTNKKNKKSFGVLLLQIIVASLFFIVFSTYLWGVQLQYDDTKIGYERALFYSLLIFGAGFSYDCAKKIIFLEQSTFLQFSNKLGHSLFDLFVIVLLTSLTAYCLNSGWIFVGQILYIGALGWVWFAINSITDTIELANIN